MPKGETSRPSNRSEKTIAKITGLGSKYSETMRKSGAANNKKESAALKEADTLNKLRKAQNKRQKNRDFNAKGQLGSTRNTNKMISKRTKK